MNFSSKLIETSVQEFAKLPGIGKKTALRLVLHLLKQDKQQVNAFANALIAMKEGIQHCERCFNLSDAPLCQICKNHTTGSKSICVVESVRDLMAIASTQQHNGTYHVLGGLISPLDGVGPDMLTIEALFKRIKDEDVSELIMALSPTMEGDTTIYYIMKHIENSTLKVTTLSRGVAFGGELEYTDELTLARSLQNRLPVERVSHSRN